MALMILLGMLKEWFYPSDESKAYVANYYNGLVVIDITDPSNPTKDGSYDTAWVCLWSGFIK